jgi:hypothetical protein
MDVDLPRLERDAGPAFSHVQGIGNANDTGLQREGFSARPMGNNRMQHFRSEDGHGWDIVKALEQLLYLRSGEEQAVLLMIDTVDGHPDVMDKRRKDDDNLGVLNRQTVIDDNTRLNTLIHEQPEQLQSDIRDDLDMDRSVIAHAQPLDSVDVGNLPEGVELVISIHPVDELL